MSVTVEVPSPVAVAEEADRHLAPTAGPPVILAGATTVRSAIRAGDRVRSDAALALAAG